MVCQFVRLAVRLSGCVHAAILFRFSLVLKPKFNTKRRYRAICEQISASSQPAPFL